MDEKNLIPAQETGLLTTAESPLDMILNPVLFEQLQRGANLFAKSGLVPAQFKDNPAACFVGLQLAQQLGVNPFMLFQKLYSPAGGKIAMEAQLAIAVANQRGVFAGPITYEFTGERETDGWACTAAAILSRSGKRVELPVTYATVRGEGWLKNPKWKTMPEQMFRYRAATWLIRTYAPEVLMGLSTADEVEDMNVIDITPRKPDEPTVREKVAAAKEEKPEDATVTKRKPKDKPTDPFDALTPQQIAKARGKLNISKDRADLTTEDRAAIVGAAGEE
jgi:hypothetical protein